MSPRASFFATLCCLATSALAQDAVILKTNVRSEGQILGVANNAIKIKVGPAETSIPVAQVASVTMKAPKAYDDAMAMWKTGDAQKTLPLLKPVVDNFRGLPVLWAQGASALLGEVYLSLDQIPAAETAFAEFQKAYPTATSVSDIGLARLAVSKASPSAADYATAKTKLAPIIEESKKAVLAESGKSSTYGQAYYLMGIIQESEKALPEALQSYLTTVTIFYEDQAVAAKAQERADALTKQQVIVP